VPEYCTPEWYAERETAPHVDQALHRPRLDLAAAMVNGLVDTTVVDLGAGDGGLLTLLRPGHVAWGYDLQPSNVEAAARRGVDVRYCDVLADPVLWGEVSVATEMIEHLLDPHAFVRRILVHSRYVVASSPWTETAEDHYGYHTWAWDHAGYRALFTDAGWRVALHDTTGMFQVLLAVRP
jgi:hypothetical protein